MYQKILVPLDGSKVAEAILPCVVWLARGFGARVTLLTVAPSRKEAGQPSPRASGPNSVETMEGLAIEPTRYLEGVAKYLAVRHIEAEPVVVEGDAAETILAQARERGCDLFAMSTRGRSGLGRGLLGSVTDAVIRSSDIPVVVVSPKGGPQGQEEGMALKRVVVPLDGSSLAETVLPHVKEMARRLSLEVDLIGVVTVPTWPGAGYEGYPVEVTGLEERMEADAAAYLERVGRGFSDEGIPTRWKVLKGSPGLTILSYVQGSSENLVAISTHGRSGLGRLVIGSVADLLIRSLGTPVLVVGPSHTV
jgi:nucleotide-binding universal stress UspA family protein